MVNTCPVLSTGAIAVNLQTHSARQALKLFSTYRWGTGGSEGLRNSPTVTQLAWGQGQDLSPGRLARVHTSDRDALRSFSLFQLLLWQMRRAQHRPVASQGHTVNECRAQTCSRTLALGNGVFALECERACHSHPRLLCPAQASG